MTQSGIKTAIWAVNPFEFDSIPDFASFQQIKTYLGGSFENLWPVFVCGPAHLENWKENENVKKTRQFLSGIGLRELEMVPFDSDKQKDLVEELLGFAVSKKADLLLMTSRGHSRLAKFFLGSFAEEMLAIATMPVLFLTKNNRHHEYTRKALFASDFSEHSKKVYHHFLKQMGPNLEELILYHAISLPVATLSASAFSGIPATLTDRELEEQMHHAQSLCESWMNEARMNHLKVRFHSKVDQAVESLGRAILDVARAEQVGMVALASHAGPLHEMFLGSVTRDVFEVATYPVWVCGPQF